MLFFHNASRGEGCDLVLRGLNKFLIGYFPFVFGLHVASWRLWMKQRVLWSVKDKGLSGKVKDEGSGRSV